MNRKTTRSIGAIFWTAILALASVAGLSAGRGSPTDATAPSLSNFFLRSPTKILARDLTGRLQVHDPVFLRDDSGRWSQVGYVESTSETTASGSATTVGLVWHSQRHSAQDFTLTGYRNSGRLEDVIATMLPPDQQQKIQSRLAEMLAQHGDELSAAFVPLVQQSLARSMPVVEQELRTSISRHRKEIDQIIARWHDDLIEKRLVPLAKKEIMPIVKLHGEPQAKQIGRELWDKASIWSFGWRAIYDQSPLPRRDLLQEEWDRFVDEEAVPVFESHMDEIAVAIQRIVIDVSENERVRDELSEVVASIGTDPEAQALVQTILKEALVENDKLRQVWSEVWSSDEARRALNLAGQRLEPIARQIGDDLFGTRETGIHPNFARVLRNQILGKDRRWIVATKDSNGLPNGDDRATELAKIELSRETMPYPIVYLASDVQTSTEVGP